MVCYRTGDETGEFIMEDRKGSEDILPDSQADMTSGFLSKECFGVLLNDRKDAEGEEGRLGPMIICAVPRRRRRRTLTCTWSVLHLLF